MTDTRATREINVNPDAIPYGTSGLDAPTFYADYIRGTIVASGVVKLNFVDNRLDALESELKTVRVATIIAPLAQLRAWANYLTILADQHGVEIPPAEEAGADG
jgi:hypothetical protein